MTLFVYGTLKRGCSNHSIMKDLGAHFLGSAETIQPYPMYQYKDPFPYLVENPNSGDNIIGEVYKISDTYKPSIDEFEGVPTLYYPGKIKVLLNGNIVEADCYFSTRKLFPNTTELIKNYTE